MNISLILTRQCNLRCRYCFETHENDRMTRETALAAMDMLVRSGDKRCGVSFFGGEPLLQKSLIYECVAYAGQFPDIRFSFNMTTNGLLLDEEFLTFARDTSARDTDARDNRFLIALSHDGTMSRVNRLYADGRDCLAALDDKLSLLLSYRPDALIMATVAPNTASMAAESVIGLFRQGVRRLNLAPDARPDAGWDVDSMEILSEQLDAIADYVYSEFLAGRNVYFNNFEEKILSIVQNKPCHVCRLGKRKPYVDWDGTIYPCIQFGGHPAYRMGDVRHGIDEARQEDIYRRSLDKPASCRDCALAPRCVNDCACLNFQQNGRTDKVSPVQCEWQRLLIRQADGLACRMLEADPERAATRFLSKKKPSVPLFPEENS